VAHGGKGVAREPEAVAEARHALGAELSAYRRAVSCTQARLAELAGYSRSTIANVETGRQKVPRRFWERADAALRTGGVLASGYDEVEVIARRELRAAARLASSARTARSPGGHSPGPRDVLEAPPHMASLPEPASCQQREQRGGPLDVARLVSMRQHLKAIDNAHGGGTVLPMATSYLKHEITPLLNGQGGSPARALIEVVAEFQHDTGWAAYDASQQDLATGYFGSALRFAHAAGNRMLGARILAAMSHQAIYLGRLRQAIDFAQAARAATRQIATPRAAAMLAAMEACAHAAAGDAKLSAQALDDAANALTCVTNGEPDPDWLDFDEGGYWGHAARAYRDLGDLHKAEEYAEKSAGLCLPGHTRTHAQRNAIQATAHLRLREIDAAAAAGQQVIRDAWNLRSGHVFDEITQLAEAISGFDAAEARDFLDQAHDLLAARRQTPARSGG
jgi:transcriptional regulator with XRE-family HTH domain